jgi:hypothetical protein
LVITIHLEDLSTLEYIHSVLKLGKITINRDHKSPNCSLRISRTDLQEVLFPLLLHHGIFFLTEVRRAQFNLAMFILELLPLRCVSQKQREELKIYDQIPEFNGFSGAPTAMANASLAVSRGKKSKEIPLYFELPKTASFAFALPFASLAFVTLACYPGGNGGLRVFILILIKITFAFGYATQRQKEQRLRLLPLCLGRTFSLPAK